MEQMMKSFSPLTCAIYDSKTDQFVNKVDDGSILLSVFERQNSPRVPVKMVLSISKSTFFFDFLSDFNL